MTIELNTTPVIEALRLLQSQLSPAGMQPVYREIGNTLAHNITLNLGSGHDFHGMPFAPLKKPRKTDKGFGTSVPLNDTRQHIYNKITFNADGTGVTVGILEDTPIGRTHQFGAPSKNIPARPFLPINFAGQVDLPADWSADIMRIIQAQIG